MAEQHTKVLQALGLPDDKIAELDKLTDLKDFKPETYTGTLTDIQKNKLLNDSDFLNSIPEDKLPTLKKAIESGQYTRFLKELTEVGNEIGIKTEDIPEETRKSLKGLAREINKRNLEKHGGGDKGAVTELQTKLQDALKNYDDLSKSQQAKIDEILAKEKGSVTQKMESLVAKIKVAGIKGLTVKPEYITAEAHNKVKAVHDVIFNTETMEFDLKKKGQPQLDVLKPNGSKLLYEEELTRVLREDGLIGDKLPEPGKAPVTVRVNGENDVVLPDYISKKMQPGLKEESAK